MLNSKNAKNEVVYKIRNIIAISKILLPSWLLLTACLTLHYLRGGCHP